MADTTIKLMTDEDIKSRSSGEVTNRRDINYKSYRAHIGGLYDPRIFGALDQCSCGRIRTPGSYCPQCHEYVYDMEDYSKKFAYYSLVMPYVAFYKYPALEAKLASYGINVKIKSVEDLWSIFFDIREDTKQITEEPQGPEAFNDEFDDFEFVPTVDLIKDGKVYKMMVRDLLPSGDPNDDPSTNRQYIGACGLQKLREFRTKSGQGFEWVDQFVNSLLPISSPAFRQISYFWLNGGKHAHIPDETNDYAATIYYNELLDSKMNSYQSMVDRATLACVLNAMVNKAMEKNDLLKTSKASLIRNLIQTRTGRTMRSNIVSAPDITIDYIKVPRSLAYYALQSDIIERMKGENNAHKLQAYFNKDPEAIRCMEDIIDESICTMCRNPSLHKFSVLAFHPILWDEIAFGLPNLVCEGFNADFDGDQMWMQLITDPGLVASMESMLPSKLWFYEKQMRSPYVPKHETLFGLHVATQVKPADVMKMYNTFNEAHDDYDRGNISIDQQIMIGEEVTSIGRATVNQIIGRDIFVDDPALFNIKENGITDQNIGPIVSMLYSMDDRTTKLLDLQNFGDSVATLEGLSSVPFSNIYKNNPEEVKAILSTDEPIEIKLKQLKDYTANTMKKIVEELPDSNIEAMLKGSGRVKIGNLVDMYAPTIRVSDMGVRFDATNIFSGLDEQSFMENAAYQRQMLQMKQDLTPVSGYDQRQLVNAEIKLTYDKENHSDDTEGVFLKIKDAVGRTTVEGNIITLDDLKKSGENTKVKVKSCINNGSATKVYKDEISQQAGRYSIEDGAFIGVSFASSLTEAVTQGALGLKHGGSLTSTEDAVIRAVEPGEVTKITKDFIEVTGNHLYKYRRTTYVSPDYKIKVGVKVTEGTVLARSTKRIRVDYNLSQFNSLTDCNVSGDLGKTVATCISYAPVSGVLNYYGDDLYIGDIQVGLSQDYLYFYPDGYKVNVGDRINTGVLNVSSYLTLSGSVSWTYYCFYENLKYIFGNINSELAETLFKSIRSAGFSVQKRMYNEPDFLLRMYSGATKSGLQNLLTKAIVDGLDEPSEDGKVGIPVMESALSPILIMGGISG